MVVLGVGDTITRGRGNSDDVRVGRIEEDVRDRVGRGWMSSVVVLWTSVKMISAEVERMRDSNVGVARDEVPIVLSGN